MSFWKQHEEYTLLESYQNGSLTELCKVILMAAMNEENIVKTRKTLTIVMADLTGIDLRRIQKTLKGLHSRGFGTCIDSKTFRVHPNHAGKSKTKPVYEGANPQYSDEAWNFLTRYHVIFDKQKYAKKKDDEMSPVMKKRFDDLQDQNQKIMDQNARMMEFLRSIAKGLTTVEAKEQAECHLKLIEGGKEG